MEDGFIKGFLLFPVTLAHIDKVAPEFAFLDELLQLLHIEGVVQETVKLVPLVDYPFPARPSPDGKGGGEEIVGWHILGDFFGVESGNHADAGVVFVFIQHLLAELEKGDGGHIVVFQYDSLADFGEGPFLRNVLRRVAAEILFLIKPFYFTFPVYL